MNFPRGLFRLWLVLSVLWIGGVVCLTWHDLQLPRSGPFNDLIADAVIGRGIKVALIPPVVILAIGSALVWAFKGFRRT